MEDYEVIERYSDMVYKVAFGYAKNRTDTDDIFQEVFLRYYKKERSFSSEEHRKAWLIRVTINCSKDFLMSRSKHLPIGEEAERIGYYDKIDDGDVFRALDTLESDSRDIVYMFYYEDMSIKSISEAIDMNENTVKTKLSRARKKLAEVLEE